ncbi:MAG: glycosyltransferase family 4 protein [Patescibacteria group bacterium]|jgi:glycosyltransferase involved in cell wall biosynthesis
MNIAILSPLWKKVPPEKYGGTELVVANLINGLARLGHKVVTFACAGSQVDCELVEVIPDEMYNLAGGFKWDAIQSYEFLAYYKLGLRINDFDIVHNHMGVHPIALAPFINVPFLTTLHSSLSSDFKHLEDEFANENFVSISLAQRKLAPNLNYIANVYHGIDINSFIPNYKPGTYLFFIGTLSYNKGIDIAVRTASKLNLPLIIAGEIRESEKDFLNKEVFPLIDGEKIKFIGEVNHKEKAALYAGAKALLFPSRWNEAFGLVIAESLACGTPVIAMNNGSPSEIIENGKTGYTVNLEEEFVIATKNISEISREICRSEAVARFSLLEMAKQYTDVYSKLINRK